MLDDRSNPVEGSEQVGTLPVIVVSRDAINQYSSVIVVMPVSNAENIKRDYPNNDIMIEAGMGGLTAVSVTLEGQVKGIAETHSL